jgi:hypothetical protein
VIKQATGPEQGGDVGGRVRAPARPPGRREQVELKRRRSALSPEDLGRDIGDGEAVDAERVT